MNIELINKLHEKTELKGGHWLWRGSLFSAGYGSFYYNGTTWTVGRLALCIYLKLHYKDKWQVCHIDSICPYKNCWSPLHIFPGTAKDNTKGRIEQGTQIIINDYNINRNKTHCKCGRLYDRRNKRERYCSFCKRETSRRNYRLKR